MTESAPKDPFGLQGQTLATRFVIERYVAEGGFGVVYRARQTALDRRVAIKVLKSPGDAPSAVREQLLTKFEAEARLLARLKHPHIAVRKSDR
jgi:serine/threonine protein kinase